MFDVLAAKHQASTVDFLKIDADKVLKKDAPSGLRLSVRFDGQRYNEKRLPEDRSSGISMVDRRSEPGYFLVQQVGKTCQGYQAYPCQGYRRGIQKDWRWKYSEL